MSKNKTTDTEEIPKLAHSMADFEESITYRTETTQLTTTFRKLRAANACTARYKHLAKALGGITKYGRDKPITILQILDICGLDDMHWAVCESIEVSKERERFNTFLRKQDETAYAAGCAVFDEVERRGQSWATCNVLYREAKNKAQQDDTVKIRKYLQGTP